MQRHCLFTRGALEDHLTDLSFFFSFYFFSHYAIQASLELTMKPRTELLIFLPLPRQRRVSGCVWHPAHFPERVQAHSRAAGTRHCCPGFSFGKELWTSCLGSEPFLSWSLTPIPIVFFSAKASCVPHSCQACLPPIQALTVHMHTLVNTTWCVTSHLHHLHFVLEISKLRLHVTMKETKEKDIVFIMSYKCINLSIHVRRKDNSLKIYKHQL